MLNLTIASALASLSLGPFTGVGPPTTLVIPPADGGPARSVSMPYLPVLTDFAQPLSSDSSAPALGDDEPPCRKYASEPASQSDMSFAGCWNLKKAVWEMGKPSATGPSLPEMNTPLGQDAPDGGKPRQTPTP